MNKFYKTNIAVLLITAILIVLFMSIFPRSSGRSGTETRELTEFPDFSMESYFSGEYTATITKWFTDTIPYRDTILDLASGIRNLYGIDYVVKTDDGRELHFEANGDLKDGINDFAPESDVSDPLIDEGVTDNYSAPDELPSDIFEEDVQSTPSDLFED